MEKNIFGDIVNTAGDVLDTLLGFLKDVFNFVFGWTGLHV